MDTSWNQSTVMKIWFHVISWNPWNPWNQHVTNVDRKHSFHDFILKKCKSKFSFTIPHCTQALLDRDTKVFPRNVANYNYSSHQHAKMFHMLLSKMKTC